MWGTAPAFLLASGRIAVALLAGILRLAGLPVSAAEQGRPFAPMACLVMIEKDDSISFIQEQWLGVKCSWIRECSTNHYLTIGVVVGVVVDHDV